MTKEEAIKVLLSKPAIAPSNSERQKKLNEAIDMAIESLQTDIVRCRECKHLFADGRCEEFADDGIRPSVSDFCSYGERRKP